MRKLNINHPSDGSPGSEAGEVGGGPRPDARAGPRDQDDLASQGAAGGGNGPLQAEFYGG